MKLSRHQLYLLVWTVPQGRIADALRKSDTWLKIVSKGLDVPTPPRGYWSQQKQGRAPTRTPLPDPDLVQLTSVDLPREALLRLLDEARADAATRRALLSDQVSRHSLQLGNGSPVDDPGRRSEPAQDPPVTLTGTGGVDDGEAGPTPGHGSDETPADPWFGVPPAGNRVERSRATLTGRQRPPERASECLLPVSLAQLEALGDELERHERAARFITSVEAQLPALPPRPRAFMGWWIVLAREQLEALDPVQRWLGACSAAAEQGDWSALGRLAGLDTLQQDEPKARAPARANAK